MRWKGGVLQLIEKIHPLIREETIGLWTFISFEKHVITEAGSQKACDIEKVKVSGL